MKLNWGHGITLAIIAFMSFILYIVVQTYSLNADLIQDDFYEEEIRTNAKKIMAQNYAKLNTRIEVEQKEEGIIVVFPKELANATGRIQFYRRDDKRLDKFYEIKLDTNNSQTLTYTDFLTGAYDIKIECAKGETKYLHQSSILF